MFKLNVISDFSSAHKLIGYEGKCKNLHGHNWKVRVGILCKDVDKIGMAIDFTIIKSHLEEIINYLDHSNLNDLQEFKEKNPTSENIAVFIFKEYSKKINRKGCSVADVEIWESDRSSVIYSE